MRPLSLEEKEAIALLKQAAKVWPESLWLFSANGRLCVMGKDHDNERVYTGFGAADQDYIIDQINIENDGGDF